MQTSGLEALAARVASVSVEAGRRGRKRKKTSRRRPAPVSVPSVAEDILKTDPEYSCRIELDITADFEGITNKQALVRKIKAELLAAVKSGITSVARGLNLKSSGVKVRPLRLECDINDA